MEFTVIVTGCPSMGTEHIRKALIKAMREGDPEIEHYGIALCGITVDVERVN